MQNDERRIVRRKINLKFIIFIKKSFLFGMMFSFLYKRETEKNKIEL